MCEGRANDRDLIFIANFTALTIFDSARLSIKDPNSQTNSWNDWKSSARAEL
jgi:hypothetical protein